MASPIIEGDAFPGQDNVQNFENTGYCLLSLDGGGVRGLSTLYILQNIMNRLNYMREEAGLEHKKPCQIFDLIGGTSTGGLIAIMLGRLEMSVEECIDAYTKLMKQIFEKKDKRLYMGVFGRVKPRFSSKALEAAIVQVLEDRGVSKDEKLEIPHSAGAQASLKCKVFVCTRFQKTNTTTRLRSYRVPSGSVFHPTIVEAALATTAAPTYFSSASIDSSGFIDGALGANNPVLNVEEEAADLWCEDTGDLKPLVKTFISIGTGRPGLRSVSDKGLRYLVETLQREAMETEGTNQLWESRWREAMAARCFRFNVVQGLEKVSLAEYEQRDLLRTATLAYLGERATKGVVNACVLNLRKKEFRPTHASKHVIQRSRSPAVTTPRATHEEITELITLGTAHLKSSPPSLAALLQARHLFAKALHHLQFVPDTSPKQVARVCQKLAETLLALSRATRDVGMRTEYAERAREYGEVALKNVEGGGDECVVAQVWFLLACAGAWAFCVIGDEGDEGGVERASDMLGERLEGLRGFGELDFRKYEEQAERYRRYLGRMGRRGSSSMGE